MKRKQLIRLGKKIRLERHQVKTRYGKLYNEVGKILFRHDPMGINFETNTDEYEPEVGTILPRLKEASSALELRRIIHQEFEEWFGDAGTESAYEGVAQEIWAVWRRCPKETHLADASC